MQIRLLSFIAFAFLLSISSLSAATNRYAENTVLHQIENDYLVGNISLDDKVLLQVNSIKQPDNTPVQYLSTSSMLSGQGLREATLALIEMRKVWELLEISTQNSISATLTRTETEFTLISPSGFFKFHYGTSGTSAVPLLDADSDLVPDFVEQCISYCDSSLAKQLEMGFLPPPSDGLAGGDSLYDVYFQSMAFYGYAVPEGLGSYPWNDQYSHLVLNNDFIGFPPNSDPEGLVAGAAKATAAHEFHHAIQFGYDANEDIWAMEAGATFIEEIVFDLVNDNYGYLDDFLDFPHTSLMDVGGLHMYGAFVWPLYLAQKFDTSLYLASWEGARYDDLFVSLGDSLLANYGWTLDAAYTDFSYWIYSTASFDDGNHFTEAANYDPIAISATHITYPVGITNSVSSVGGYASEYITFYPGAAAGKLKLTFNGSDSRNWSAYVIKSMTANDHTVATISLDTLTQEGEILVSDFHDYYSVTLVGVNLDEYSSAVLFTYSAEILPFELSLSVISPIDPFVYSGGVRSVDVLVRNTAPVNDIVNLIYYDSDGWLPLDTFAFALASGDSSIVSLDVTPQQGTPIGETAILSFKAESWGDPTVFDLQTKLSQISLYRGDFDFSGEIDISDLVYAVDFIFTGGPTPIPNEFAGDIECSNATDISDLVYLVDFIFTGGPGSPCNPY